jgi:putative transposase
MQNGFVESSNGRLGDDLMNEVLFSGLPDARAQVRVRRHDYNHHRPHSGLGNVSPAEFAEQKGLAVRAT